MLPATPPAFPPEKWRPSVSYDLTGVIADQNVQATAGATFAYDAAGNRTGMTDGLGSMTYAYDALSRLSSETRQFADLQGKTYTLAYAYNFAGQLKSVTDSATNAGGSGGPWPGTSVAYGYDAAGSITNVTGTGFGTVTQLASNIQYRAWGAVKAMNYGNGGADERAVRRSYAADALRA